MPSQLTGGSKTSIYLYQALFGQAPGAKLLSDATANATTNTVAFANELGAGFNAVPTATFVAGVLTNLGLSSTYAGFSAGGYAGLQAALVQYYDAAGVANRGYVTLQLASLLTDSAHERDATYGSAAANFINQTAANYNYASVSTNTASAAVPVAPVVSLALTTGADSITGTAGNDLFLAWISNNTNTLQSGDVIDGGLGVNRLEADIGNSQNFAITASTKNVQTVAIRAEAVANDTNNNNMVDVAAGATGNQVQIDAQRMVGVTQWESNNSRADVVIEDVRIQANQITKDITIAMVETDPGHVDFGVYFDQLSLRNTSSSTSQLNLQVMDTRSVVSGTAPLLSSPYAGFRFTSTNEAGVATVITLQSQAIDDAQTYAELVTAYQAAANAVFGAGVVTVSLGKSFTVTDTTTGTAVSGNEITISAAGKFTFTTPTGSGFIATGVVPANSGLHTNFNTGSVASTELVTSKIILDDVGRGSTGGDLVVGGLSVGDTSSSLGVQRFEIEVRDNSKLETINSTNNTLREVTIVNGETTSKSSAYVTTVTNAGNLTVNGISGSNGAAVDEPTGQNAPLPGSEKQHNTYGFSDVRLIDGSAMKGNLAFTAEVTTASIAKYLNLKDGAPALPAADNVAFVYTGGAGNDTMKVVIDSAVAASNTLTGREDFTFALNGGDGNDKLTLEIGGDKTGAWYVDQKLNANIAVNGGTGDDTIWTKGAGDVKIDAGAGADTVYADNSGTVGGTWLVSAANSAVNDLQAATTTTNFLYKGKLTVAFSAPSTSGTVTEGAAASATNGWAVVVDIPTGDNYAVSQLHINQAIKKAINEDPTMSKLLSATDGPGNTLVIKSLIDGSFTNTDLKMTVSATAVNDASYSATEQAAILLAYQTYAKDSTVANTTAVQAIEAASVIAKNAVAGMDAAPVLATSTSDLVFTTNVVTSGVAAATEEFVATFAAATAAGNLVFAGVTVALVGSETADQVATKVLAATYATGGDAWTDVAGVGTNQVKFTSGAANSTVTDKTAASFVFTPATVGTYTAPVLSAYVDGTAGVKEVFTVTVTGKAQAGEVVTFDSENTTALTTASTTSDVATALIGAAGHTYAEGVASGNSVTFTASAVGNPTDAKAADFATNKGSVVNGTISTAQSDNTINLGAGNDVVVLGTGALSNDKLVFTGYGLGTDTIVNFSSVAVGVTNGDILDFSSYLVDMKSASGSTISQTKIVTTVVAGINTTVAANSVTVLTTGAFDDTVATKTFAGLTEAKLLAAINTTGNTAYAGIVDGSLSAVNNVSSANLVGGIGHAVVLIENNQNRGEYAAFELTFNGAATTGTDFTAAKLIGVMDFGHEVVLTTGSIAGV